MMLDYFGFALLCCVIGPENLCHNLNKSDVKLKPNTIWSPAFFPRFKKVASFYSESSLANDDGNLLF